MDKGHFFQSYQNLWSFYCLILVMMYEHLLSQSVFDSCRQMRHGVRSVATTVGPVRVRDLLTQRNFTGFVHFGHRGRGEAITNIQAFARKTDILCATASEQCHQCDRAKEGKFRHCPVLRRVFVPASFKTRHHPAPQSSLRPDCASPA